MTDEFNQFDLWTGLFGGLALFLFGMDLMTRALKRAAGDHMRDLLGRFTRNRFIGVGMGALVTGVVAAGLGFGLEAVATDEERARLMRQALNYLAAQAGG